MLITREELTLHDVRFDKTYPAGDLDYGKFCQADPLRLQGLAQLVEGEIRIRGRLETRLEAECDRCIASVAIPILRDFDLFYRPVGSIAREEEIEVSADELEVGFYSGAGVELDEVAREQVILSVPMKVVCAPDCKGLCPGCGANLNAEACRCERPQDISPFESLRHH